jgi:hypothetical protein
LDTPDSALERVRSAIERAHFEEARQRAAELLARRDLIARTRNHALELSAIAEVAARHERAAQRSLTLLFSRDPEHPRRVHDPGPVVDGAFARARARKPRPLATRLTIAFESGEPGVLLVHVKLLEGADAVESVHALASYPGLSEPLEMVVHPQLREEVTLRLPAPPASAGNIPVVVEARAPSGFVLERLAQEAAPAPPRAEEVRREAPPCPKQPALRRAWWLWTGVSIVAAGLAVSAGAVAH